VLQQVQPVAVFWVWGPVQPPLVVLVPRELELQALGQAQHQPVPPVLGLERLERAQEPQPLRQARRSPAGCSAPWQAMAHRQAST
jgi:hypothetical protein